MTLRERVSPSIACALDAVGCALGGFVLLKSPIVWSWISLPAGWRIPVAALLLVFAGFALVAFKAPSRRAVSLVVVGNAAWIVAGGIALTVTNAIAGMVIIAAIMLMDAIMIWLQLPGITSSRATTRPGS